MKNLKPIMSEYYHKIKLLVKDWTHKALNTNKLMKSKESVEICSSGEYLTN